MMKKFVSFVTAVCMLMSCWVVVTAENSESSVLYDMIEKGTWGATANFISIDSERFPDRGDVICSNVGSAAGVTLYDAFEEEIRKGKMRISFEFYADEEYVGFPEFYLSIANMVPFDRTLNWNCTPAFYPNATGKVQYYGGRNSSGSIDWTIYPTDSVITKGKWHKMESIVDFDDKGKVKGYLDGEKLYEVNGATVISGLLFVIAGKSASHGKLYFDNITVSPVRNDLSASYAYGEGDCAIIEFSQPITPENASDVTAIETTTGKEVEIIEISKVSGNLISYRMPEGKPYAEYMFIFGDKNVSDFGSSITGSMKIAGSVGVSEDSRIETPAEEVLLEDNFDSYNPMAYTTSTITWDTSIWSRTGDISTNIWWGMGALVSAEKKMQIHCFHGGIGDVRGIKGKISETPQNSGIVSVSCDISFDDYEPVDKNGMRMDIVSGGSSYPIFDIRAESVAVFKNQEKGEETEVLTQIKKENNDSAKKYELVLDFDSGIIMAEIDGTSVGELTMNEALKASGITDIAFMGCKNAEINRQKVCNGALIDNIIVKSKHIEYDYNPGVMGVRFIEKDGTEKIAVDNISPVTEKVVVKFSEAVSTENLDQIVITNSKGEISYNGEWNKDTNSWEMEIPEGNLMVKSLHNIFVPDTICDMKGYKLIAPYECGFATGSNSRTVNIAYINEFIENEDKEGLATLLEEDPEGIGVATEVFEKADKIELAEMIIDYANESALSDTDETMKDLQKLVLMECANNERAKNLWDNDFTYGVDDIQVFELMEDRLSEYITELISGKNIDTVEEFDVELRDAVILTGINYADGKSRVENIIETFEDVIGDGESLKLTDAKCKAVYTKGDFETIAELRNYIKNYKTETTGGSSGGGGGGGRGGAVSASTNKAASVADNKVYTQDETVVEEKTPIFTDIADYPWAEEAINELFARGVIVGREKNLFVPGDEVLREESAKIIVEAFKFYMKGTIKFDDVKEEDWFYPYIVRAFNSGVISGISENEFGSGQSVTKQDLAVMVYNAMIAAGVIEPVELDEKEFFVDHDRISDYALNAVYALKKAGVISGDNNRVYNPQNYASRAETAKIVYLATQYLK